MMKSRPGSNYSSVYSSGKKDMYLSGPAGSPKPTAMRPQSNEISKRLEGTKRLLKGTDSGVGASKLVSQISHDIHSKLGLNKLGKEPARTFGSSTMSTSIKSVTQYRHSSTLDPSNSSKAAGKLTDLFGQFEKKLEHQKKQDSLSEALEKIKQTQLLTSKEAVPQQHPRVRPTANTFSNRKYSEIKNSSLYNIYNVNKTAEKRPNITEQLRQTGLRGEPKYTGIHELDQYKQYSKQRSELAVRDKRTPTTTAAVPPQKKLTYSESAGLAEVQPPTDILAGDKELGDESRDPGASEDQADIEHLDLALGEAIVIPEVVTAKTSDKKSNGREKELTSPVDVRPGKLSESPAQSTTLSELKQEIERLREENVQLKADILSERTVMTQQIKQLDDEKRKLELVRTEASAEMECAKTEWGKIKTSQAEVEEKLKQLSAKELELQEGFARLQSELSALEVKKESEIKSSDVKIEFNIKPDVEIIGGAQLVDSGGEFGANPWGQTNPIQTSDPFDSAFGGAADFKFDFVDAGAPSSELPKEQPKKDIFGSMDGESAGGFFGEPEKDKSKKIIFESMIDGPQEPASWSNYASVSPYDEKAKLELDAAIKVDSGSGSPAARQIVQADSFILDEEGNEVGGAKEVPADDGVAGVTNSELGKLKAKLEQAEKARTRREAECETLHARIVALENEKKEVARSVTTLSCHNSALQNLVYQLGREKAALREKGQSKRVLAGASASAEEPGKLLAEQPQSKAAETIKSAATGENQSSRHFDEQDFPSVDEEPKSVFSECGFHCFWGLGCPPKNAS